MNNKLEKNFALGKWRFIVRYGMLGFGVLGAALFSAVWCYTKGSVRLVDVIIPFILFPIGGIAWGTYMWSFFKKKHDQAVAGSTK